MGLEARRERVVMKEPGGRKDRDVARHPVVDQQDRLRTPRWKPWRWRFPGSFNTEWGQDVWREVSSQAHDKLKPPTGPSPVGSQVALIPHSPHPPEGAAGDTISRSVAYLFETCDHHSYFENEEARHRRMRACVEAAASLVCRLDYRLDWFGEVSKVVSEIGQVEKVNSPTTTSDRSFIMRWTCLSLMDIQRILGRNNKLRALAGNAVNGLARFQSGHGQPDQTGWESAQRVDGYLKTACERVEDLRLAFEPWTQKRTREQVEEILLTHEQQISELERIKSEADELAVVDREISVYQDAMDDATHRLTRQLPWCNILQGYVGPDDDIREAVREIESADPDKDIRDTVWEIDDVESIRMDRKELKRRALAALPRFRDNPGYFEHIVADPVG
ncbi:hypothetical protein EDB83DRAFT_2520209 [Lactarius deliciosus]|nr:hypothetical protein EDB83DRAFT_2520209 [Lactarius deliciosus]